MKRTQGAALVAGVMLALSSLASANDNGTFTVALENDVFGQDSDKHYTHGTEITYVTAPTLRDLTVLDWFGWNDAADQTRFVWSFGQQIYTPEKRSRHEVVEDDRPYAGWLYISGGVIHEQTQGTRTIDRLDLILGTVGPNSLAEDAQRIIHDITGSPKPNGWDNQLDNEITLDLQWQRLWMLPLIEGHVDLVPQVYATLGSSQRYAGTGATLRVGSGLGADYGAPLIRPTASGSHYFSTGSSFYWYLFLGANGRYVDHNIFLDGNTNSQSHKVERKDWVGDVQAGLVVGAGNWRLTLTSIVRSREFETQREPDEFGAVSITYHF